MEVPKGKRKVGVGRDAARPGRTTRDRIAHFPKKLMRPNDALIGHQYICLTFGKSKRPAGTFSQDYFYHCTEEMLSVRRYKSAIVWRVVDHEIRDGRLGNSGPSFETPQEWQEILADLLSIASIIVLIHGPAAPLVANHSRNEAGRFASSGILNISV